MRFVNSRPATGTFGFANLGWKRKRLKLLWKILRELPSRCHLKRSRNNRQSLLQFNRKFTKAETV